MEGIAKFKIIGFMIPRETIVKDAYKALESDFSNHPPPYQNEIRTRVVIYALKGPIESHFVEFEFKDGEWKVLTIDAKEIGGTNREY